MQGHEYVCFTSSVITTIPNLLSLPVKLDTIVEHQLKLLYHNVHVKQFSGE